jgi:hypothetical protein
MGAKSTFKTNEISTKVIPRYAEISVKGLYDDALLLPDVAKYLPDKDHMKNRLPERTFFFGILATARH